MEFTLCFPFHSFGNPFLHIPHEFRHKCHYRRLLIMILEYIVDQPKSFYLLRSFSSIHFLLVFFVFLLNSTLTDSRAVPQDTPNSFDTPDTPGNEGKLEDTNNGIIAQNDDTAFMTRESPPQKTVIVVISIREIIATDPPPEMIAITTAIVTTVGERGVASEEERSSQDNTGATEINGASRTQNTGSAIGDADETGSIEPAPREGEPSLASGSLIPTYSTLGITVDGSSVDSLPGGNSDQFPDSPVLTASQKIGIGLGVPLGLILFAAIIVYFTRWHLLRNKRAGNGIPRDRNGEGGFSELDGGWASPWAGGQLDTNEARAGLPSWYGATESGAFGSHSVKELLDTSHPFDSADGDCASMGSKKIVVEQKAHRDKRRPIDLQPLTLLPTLQRSSPGPFLRGGMPSPHGGMPSPRGGMPSPRAKQGHQSLMSSKSASTLGLTAFSIPEQGHERHESTSTRRSLKSRKGSTATMMTNNYEMELTTISSASDPQYPVTPMDDPPGDIYMGKNYTIPYGYSQFGLDRDGITPIKSHAYIQPQSPFTPQSLLSSPSFSPRSRHRHSRTSSSGINVASFIGSLPFVFSSPKPRPGASPLAGDSKVKTASKKDIRIINHDTTYFDDRDDDEEDDDVNSIHLAVSPRQSVYDPQGYFDSKQSKRRSSGLERMSRGQSDEVDGEEVWTDSEDERDSGDFILTGGLGSRFGKKNIDTEA